jgi:hypothetical protein
VSHKREDGTTNVQHVDDVITLVNERGGRHPIAVSTCCIECGATHYALMPPQGEVHEDTMTHTGSCSLDMRNIRRVFHYDRTPVGVRRSVTRKGRAIDES